MVPIKYTSITTTCIGRNIIELPNVFIKADVTTGTFKVGPAIVENRPFEVVVKSGNYTKRDFLEAVSAESSKFKVEAIPDSNVLRGEQSLSDSATLLRIQEVDDAYRDELHFMLGHDIVIAKLDSFRNEYVAAEQKLIKFMSQFSLTKQLGVGGFCLGSLSIDGDFSEEQGGYYWRDNAGNTIDIEINSFEKDSTPSLLKRMSSPDSLLNLFHIGHTVLRSGERSVAGMRAQEWLGWTNLGENGNEKTFKFVLETMRRNGGRDTPSIRITFDSAQRLPDATDTKTNMTDAEAMAVWDAMINSIRPAR